MMVDRMHTLETLSVRRVWLGYTKDRPYVAFCSCYTPSRASWLATMSKIMFVLAVSRESSFSMIQNQLEHGLAVSR